MENIPNWVFFRVIVALAPLIYLTAKLSGIPPFEKDTLLDILVRVVCHGELLLISISLCSVSIGELLIKPSTFRILKSVIGGVIILNIIVAAMFFADISTSFTLGNPNNPFQAFKVSLFLFPCAILTGIATILLPATVSTEG